MASKKIPAAEFIRVWESAQDVDEVVAKLGIEKSVIHSRASHYRKIGVKLKHMSRKPKTKVLNVAELNEIIDGIHAAEATKKQEPKKRGAR